MELDVYMFRPFVEFWIFNKSNGCLVVYVYIDNNVRSHRDSFTASEAAIYSVSVINKVDRLLSMATPRN